MPTTSGSGSWGVPRHLVLLVLLALLGACTSPPSSDVVPNEVPPGSQDPAVTDESTDDEPAEEAARPAPRPDPPDALDPPAANEPVAVVEPEPRPVEVPASPPPAPPEGRKELVENARSLLDDALEQADDGELAVLVTDTYGRQIIAHGVEAPVVPASTVKLVTAAAALTTLGPDARLVTRVETTAPVAPDGSVEGDLVLIGGGDPVLATERYERWVAPERPRTPLEELADAVVAAGVRRVEGALIGTAERYPGPASASGWPERYFRDFDARYHGGLTVDAGLQTRVTFPQVEEDGEDADRSRNATNGSEEERRPAAGTDPVTPAPGTQAGDGSQDDMDLGPPRVRLEHATDPAAQATTELLRLLTERGVEVAGDARTSTSAPVTVGRLATISSPPVADLLRYAVRHSDNHLMDALFRVVARVRTGEGSWEAGDRAVRQVLDRYGIDHRAAVFADGSGLSRENRLTPRLLVELDRAMRSSHHRSTWSSLMAVMGESGTLASRMTSTVADGRFVGKTGTLRDVAGLAGSVLGPHDRARYHLAVVANGPVPTPWIGRVLADELVLLLAADVQDCAVDATADLDPGVLGRPPLAVAC